MAQQRPVAGGGGAVVGLGAVEQQLAFVGAHPAMLERRLVDPQPEREPDRNEQRQPERELPPGKITGFVAKMGQGKTTFFKLAMSLSRSNSFRLVSVLFSWSAIGSWIED